MASELLGARELGRKLDALTMGQRASVLRAAGNAAKKPVLEEARSRIPVNKVNELHKTYKGRYVAPGFAQRSIRAKVILDRARRGMSVLWGVAREAFYAVNFVELGTSKMARHPWLRPALESSQGRVLTELSRVLKDRIEKVRRGQ